MQLYATRLEGEISDSEWQELCGLVPAYRYEKICGRRYRRDQEHLLFAGLLLRQVIKDTLGETPGDFAFNCYGKTSLEGRLDFHFNLSHAGNWVVCVTDQHPVGVDVEKMEAVDCSSLAQLVFSPEEQKRLQQKQGEQQLNYFYDVWTMKESYCKAVGQGLAIELNKLSIKDEDQDRWLIAPPGEPPWRLRQYKLESGYKLTVCASHAAFPEEVSRIYWRDLTGRGATETGKG